MTAIITRTVNSAGPYAYRVTYEDGTHEWEYLGPTGRVDPATLTDEETAQLREEGFALARFTDGVEADVRDRDVADSIRQRIKQQHGPEAIAATDDERSSTIELAEDAPRAAETILSQEAVEAEAAANAGAGQAGLSDKELDKIDWSAKGQNVMHARSAKAQLQQNGIVNWIDHYSGDIPSGSFDSVADKVKESGGSGGRRNDSNDGETGSASAMARGRGRAVERAEDAVADKTEGWQDAADVLRTEHGYTQDDIDALQAGD